MSNPVPGDTAPAQDPAPAWDCDCGDPFCIFAEPTPTATEEPS